VAISTQASGSVDSFTRLDAAAGNYAGALDQYVIAGPIDRRTPGLKQALAALAKKLTKKMREAGATAYRRARHNDTLGQSAEAVRSTRRRCSTCLTRIRTRKPRKSGWRL